MMNLPGLKPSALPQMRAGIPDRGADPAFTDAMALKGGAGAVGPIPLPLRDLERRVADRIFMQCFGDWEDIGTDAWHRTFEFPSRHIHLDGAIAAMVIDFRDELARMQQQHSLQELRDIARAGAKVAVEAIRRGDNIGFSEQFQADVYTGMNKKSREILNDRGIAESGDIVGPHRPFPEWNPDERPGLTGGGPDIGQGGEWPRVRIDPMPGMPDMPEGFMQNGGSEGSRPDFDEIRRRMDGLQRRGVQTPSDEEGTWPGGISPTEMLRNATTQGHNHALEQMERAAREAIERSLGNSPFVTGTDPIAEAIEEHGPLIELFLQALRPQYTPGILGGTPSSRPGISTATINALRNLDPKAAADIVNEQLADTIENVPPNYRNAILEALGKGDEQDPDIERAITRLEQLRKAEGPDVVDGPPVVTNVPDAIRLLQDRYGMYVAADLHNAGSDRTYHFEETFLEVVNNAIPILDEIARRHPGLLDGIGLALKTPNPRQGGDSNYFTVGVSSEQTGVIALAAPSQIAKHEIMQDPQTLFLGTVAHEVAHAMVAKADPMLVQRFRDNLEPVVTVHGPNNDNPAPGSMSRQDIIDEMYFPGATWEEFLQWAKHEGYIIQPTTEGILDSLQGLGYAPYFTPRYEGDVTIFRDPEEPACEVLGECISRYAGNEFEGLPEFFAAWILGLTEPHASDEELPHNTIGLFPNLPAPGSLLKHLDAIIESAMLGLPPSSYYSPAPISPESYANGE